MTTQIQTVRFDQFAGLCNCEPRLSVSPGGGRPVRSAHNSGLAREALPRRSYGQVLLVL